MSRNSKKLSADAERKAEKEIDAFLRKIHAAPRLEIMAELKKMS